MARCLEFEGDALWSELDQYHDRVSSLLRKQHEQALVEQLRDCVSAQVPANQNEPLRVELGRSALTCHWAVPAVHRELSRDGQTECAHQLLTPAAQLLHVLKVQIRRGFPERAALDEP